MRVERLCASWEGTATRVATSVCTWRQRLQRAEHASSGHAYWTTSQPQPPHARRTSVSIQVLPAEGSNSTPGQVRAASAAAPIAATTNAHRPSLLPKLQRPSQANLQLPLVLSRQIAACNSWMTLQQLLDQHESALTALHISAIVGRIANLHAPKEGQASAQRQQPPPQRQQQQQQQRQQQMSQPKLQQQHLPKYSQSDLHALLLRLACIVSQQLQELTPRQLAYVLWAFAKLGYHPGDVHIRAWAERFCTRLPEADTIALSQFVWALAASRHAGAPEQQQRLLDTFLMEAAGRLDDFSAQALSNTLWALATLGVAPDKRFMASFWEAALKLQLVSTPQGDSNLLWAAATLGLKPTGQWLRAMQRRWVPLMGTWGGHDVANAMWAFAKLGIEGHPRTYWLEAVVSTCPAQLGSYLPKELAQLLWGLASLGWKPSPRFNTALLRAVMEQAASFKMREWATLLWSAARLGIVPSEGWLRRSLAFIQQRLRYANAQDCSNVLWSLAVLGAVPRRPWRDRFFAECYSQLYFFTPQHTANTLWACARLGWQPPGEWSERLFLETYGQLPAFKVSELAASLYALGRMKLRPPVQWVAQAVAVAVLKIQELGPQELCNVVWGCGALRYRPPPRWLGQLGARAEELARGGLLDKRDKALLVQALAVLQYDAPGDHPLAAALMEAQNRLSNGATMQTGTTSGSQHSSLDAVTCAEPPNDANSDFVPQMAAASQAEGANPMEQPVRPQQPHGRLLGTRAWSKARAKLRSNAVASLVPVGGASSADSEGACSNTDSDILRTG